jgi:hypothetical protein
MFIFYNATVLQHLYGQNDIHTCVGYDIILQHWSNIYMHQNSCFATIQIIHFHFQFCMLQDVYPQVDITR